MHKIRAIIVDDDAYAVSQLESALASFPNVELLAAFTDPHQSISNIQLQKPDVLFLDIRMPGMSGFDLMDIIYEDVTEVIFVTSYNEYSIRALRYSALDYLEKPVHHLELKNALNRFYTRSERILSKSKILNLRQNLNAEKGDFELVLLTKSDGEKRFKAADIIRCEADSNYSQLFLTKGRKFMASKTLSDLEAMLDPQDFIRTHKSHVINKKFVQSINSEGDILLSDGAAIPISRRRIHEVRRFIGF